MLNAFVFLKKTAKDLTILYTALSFGINCASKKYWYVELKTFYWTEQNGRRPQR